MSTSPPPAPPVLPDRRLPDRHLAAGAARLAARHAGRFTPEAVQPPLPDSYGRLTATARDRTHLVVLAERFTGERLDALAHVQDSPGGVLPRVLFVHERHPGRSQSAAA
ncbi:three-helix bundle dimerization domain-containing protein [Streptomyces sp. NPDC003011]